MKKIIVVNNPRNWPLNVDGVDIVSARDYLTTPAFTALRNVRVFNLCKDYSYQSKGYYVSLLAEARGHKAIPNVKNIQDIKAPTIVKIVSDELDDLIQKSLRKIRSEEFVLSIYFGQNLSRQHLELSQELHRLFQAPFLRARFTWKNKWFLQGIRTISLDEIPENHIPALHAFAREYFDKKRYMPARPDRYIYDLAILVDPTEKSPPSDRKALQKIIAAAQETGFSVELITRKDYDRIGEFDALFIRATTAVNHHTYRFARRAQSEGLAVIDDPDSILRCSNKVYLAELMEVGRIPCPRSMIVHTENRKMVPTLLGIPCVLKLPDSSFSQGVVKVKDKDELDKQLEEMLSTSDLVIAQEFTPTEFDWRIGVLENKILYACKYFMAKGHWQVYNWKSSVKKDIVGAYQAVNLQEVPSVVLRTALKITNIIGQGLYGVDIKEIGRKAMVIEVNDNPSLESGVEDALSGQEIYLKIMQSLRRRIEERTERHKARLGMAVAKREDT